MKAELGHVAVTEQETEAFDELWTHAWLPWNIPKDCDSKANPLSSEHVVLKGGDDGWDEGFDSGKARLTHAPWLIHQKDYVCLLHRPASWHKKTS